MFWCWNFFVFLFMICKGNKNDGKMDVLSIIFLISGLWCMMIGEILWVICIGSEIGILMRVRKLSWIGEGLLCRFRSVLDVKIRI